jgi:tRNA (cytidine32/uridine32-2'-O)-methyltransferase
MPGLYLFSAEENYILSTVSPRAIYFMLDQIRIVLIHTSHPGNIGSVARAMKTMGLTQLYLVKPQLFPHAKANEMASGAGDVLEKACVVATLDEAIADCTFVAGTSARLRSIAWPSVTPRELAQRLQEEPRDSRIAILFGQEQCGLTNEELERCHLRIQIPANPEYSSLNLAAAVQVLGYELRVTLSNLYEKERGGARLANADEMERYFIHLQKVLLEIDFLKQKTPKKLMARLRRLFLRARPDVVEVNILRGILTAIKEFPLKKRE